MSNALFCNKCLLHFAVARTNTRHHPAGIECRLCKGTGEIQAKNEQGKMVSVPCDVCEGEGKVYATATCTHRKGDTYCQASHPISKRMQARFPWIGRTVVPGTRATMRERGLVARHTRKGASPWPPGR